MKKGVVYLPKQIDEDYTSLDNHFAWFDALEDDLLVFEQGDEELGFKHLSEDIGIPLPIFSAMDFDFVGVLDFTNDDRGELL